VTYCEDGLFVAVGANLQKFSGIFLRICYSSFVCFPKSVLLRLISPKFFCGISEVDLTVVKFMKSTSKLTHDI